MTEDQLADIRAWLEAKSANEAAEQALHNAQELQKETYNRVQHADTVARRHLDRQTAIEVDGWVLLLDYHGFMSRHRLVKP